MNPDPDSLEDVLLQIDRWDFAEAAWLLAGEVFRVRGLAGSVGEDGELLDPAGIGTPVLYGGHGYGTAAVDRLCRAHHQALVGMRVMQLDAEDFDELAAAPWTPQPVATVLMQASWPRMPKQRRRGALGSLDPLVRVMLEQVEIRGERRDPSELLAVVHLLSDYLPLLAWEAVAPGPGDPLTLLDRLDAAKAEWRDRDRCPQSDTVRSVASGARRSLANVDAWQSHLPRRHARVSTMLGYCGGRPDVGIIGGPACADPCGVAPADPELARDLARRLAVARVLQSSTLLDRRHGSPVGHYFSVPAMDELEEAWRATLQRIHDVIRVQGAAAALEYPDTSVLPGLAEITSFVAGHQIRPASVMAALRDDLRELIGPLT